MNQTITEGLGLPAAAVPAARADQVRGVALRLANNTGRWLATAMQALLAVALGLGALRLLVHVGADRVHRGR